MKVFIALFILFLGLANQEAAAATINFDRQFSPATISAFESMPVLANGRIKPFSTYARETILFLTGSYYWNKIDAVPLYLQILNNPNLENYEILQIRSVDLRKRLGFSADKRHYSLSEIRDSQLQEFAEPLLSMESPNSIQKEILEAFQQFLILKRIQTGDHLLSVVDFQSNNMSHAEFRFSNSDIEGIAQKFLSELRQQSAVTDGSECAVCSHLIDMIRRQKVPDSVELNPTKLSAEVVFNKLQIFFITAIGYLLVAVLLYLKKRNQKFQKTDLYFISPFLFLHLLGFSFRVWITGFAPVTNMYGTMLWVSLGVVLFSFIFHFLYQNYFITIVSFISAAALLLLTEQMPLVLSPDLDPVVAVLRSNLWLTTHVLTITISYAAFTIAMVIGNIAIWKVIRHENQDKLSADFFHYAYRIVQLGCFF